MTQRQKLQLAILRSLDQCDGAPMPEPALLEAARLLCKPKEPTLDEAKSALKDLETELLIRGLNPKLGDTTWTLTDEGKHTAASAR
jgi:hypothetical protein